MKKRLEWSNPKHAKQWLYALEEFAFPVIGDLPVDQVHMEHILAILSPIWANKTGNNLAIKGARPEWVLAVATTLRLREGFNQKSRMGYGLFQHPGVLHIFTANVLNKNILKSNQNPKKKSR